MLQVTLHHCRDTSTAAWLVASPIAWNQLVGFGPAGFGAYARLRFIPDPVRIGQAETDVDLPENHLSDYAQTRQALGILQEFTDTPDEWYFCVWDGTGHELPRTIFREPLVEVPHRRYFLASGSSADVEDWEASFPNGSAPLPAFVWPADHAWCFASDVDPHWAGIGCTRPGLKALMDSDLDIVTASPTEEQPTYF